MEFKKEELSELSDSELELVCGGTWDWSNIAGSLGYNVGQAGVWVYNNILVGDPWTIVIE